MKNWKINSWRNYPVKHIPDYPDQKDLDGVLSRLSGSKRFRWCFK